MRRLDRYILRQFVLPFIVGVLIFVIILLGDEARKLSAIIVGARVSPKLIALYLLYRTPQALVWSLPVGTLVGAAMTMTNLSRHFEAVAMRTAGVSFARISLSLVLLGTLASGACFAVNEWLVPASSEASRQVFATITRSQPVVRQEYNQFFRDDQGRIFYVRHMNADKNELSEIAIWQRDATGRLTSITVANRATLHGAVWMLEQGYTVYLDEQGNVKEGEQTEFARQPIKLHRALQHYYAEKRTPYEMTADELAHLAATLAETGQPTHALRTHWHFKYAIPVACLVFALIAAPLADRYAHLGSFTGLTIAIVLVFLYNGVRSWGLALGLAGTIPPMPAAWAQNIIFGAIGLYLLLTRR